MKTQGIVRQVIVAMGLTLAFGCMPVHANDDKPSEAQVDRVADRLVQMMPFGELMDETAKADPAWPLQERAGKSTPEQLACLRRELSADGYLRSRRVRAVEYVADNPQRVDEDLRVLDRVSPVVGRMVKLGMESGKTGKDVDPASVVKDMSADDLQSFLSFISEPKYASLRALSGLGEAFSLTRSAKENEDAGKSVGERLVGQLMIDAMATCDVPTSVLFE
jgi:hypothetical protein